MNPYYENDGITLYLGDCLEVTEWLAADVLVTDPPYGMGYQSRIGESVKADGDTRARDAALDMWLPRPAVAFGTWKAKRPPATRQVVVWDRSEGNGSAGSNWSPWRMTHEEMYLLGDWPPRAPGGRVREGGTPAHLPGVLRVSNYNTQASTRPDHPTPKPVALMEQVIAQCPPGTIADPFAGSGSTLVAARNLGRQAIGVEIEERYCEIIARRLDQAVLPL